MNVVFEMKNVNANQSNNRKIEDINYSLFESEIHTIVGVSSSDVVDFMSIFENTPQDLAGTIKVKGENVSIKDFLARNDCFSFVRNDDTLNANLSIVDNLYLINKFSFAFSRKKIIRQCENLLKAFDIPLDANRIVQELSRQERILIEIIRLYLGSADIIILQETLNYLDYESFFKMNKIIDSLKDQGKSFIYLTSRFEDALKFSDRISFLSNGKMLHTYEAEEVKKNPRKMIYIMSGWENAQMENSDRQLQELSNSIYRNTELLNSSYEMKDVLRYIAARLMKLVKAQGCIIYVFDEDVHYVMDTVKPNDKNTANVKLTSSFLKEFAKRNTSDLFFMNHYDTEFNSFFKEKNMSKTVICIPIVACSRVTGLIQVSYDTSYIYNNMDLIYFSTTSNEVALAIENSRLTGQSVLLKEIHHRIKNSLQIIVSLLYFQKEYIQDNENKNLDEVIDTVIFRIKSIASVHDILSNEQTKSGVINAKKIISKVVDLYRSPGISIKVDMENVCMPYNKGISLALVVNELISNCCKHAFCEKEGEIQVRSHFDEKGVSLIIQDNGVGINQTEIDNTKELGISFVKSIVENDFCGEINYFVDNGTTVRIDLPIDLFFAGDSA